MARKIKLGEDDGSFDIAFWSQFTPSEKMERTFELSMMWFGMQAGSHHERTFQRHVVHIQRPKD